ncbi:KTSC domain-containing protein [Chitinophaga jiangningensis]|uniref:KTSC domain-containing protein n=1 Tax=Chitinophaga jiangningensis TaxID=1419482 RepID=A0A1M6VPC8_9BACT|nr:KTSC domain-containing protein [Chitinophaga jiangningensis]SHK83382.1 KTSC domain-containing protein [Chitinophaga jiangningensis]
MPSTVVAHFSYLPEHAVLRVRYVSGKVYDYLQVPLHVYEEMKQAFSKGTYLNKNIKGKYDYREVK